MKKFFCTFDGETRAIENPHLCSFGFFEIVVPTALAAISTSIASAGVAAGIGATTAGIIGDIGTGALVGGALGAATDWKQPLKGAEMGAITGAGIAGGPLLGGALGIGAIGGDVLAGGAAGALGGMASGRGAGAGALQGATAGLTAGALGSLSQVGSPVAPAAGGSAAAAAAPGSVPISGPEAVNVTPPVQLGAPTSAVPSSVGANLPGAVGQGAATGIPTSTTGIQPASTGLAAGGAAPPAAPTLASSLPGAAASPAPTLAPSGALASSPISLGSTAANLPTSGLESVNVTPAQTLPADPSGAAGFGDALGSFFKSPTGIMSTLGMGANMIMGNKNPAGFSQMQAQAGALTQQGGQLRSFLTSGQLPPGMQHSLDRAADAARASVRSQYANSGMSGSSAEAQDVAAVGEREAAQSAQIAENLFNSGLKETELGQQMYWDLMQIQMKQDDNLSAAIGNFVTSFANMGKAPAPGGAAATGAG